MGDFDNFQCLMDTFDAQRKIPLIKGLDFAGLRSCQQISYRRSMPLAATGRSNTALIERLLI
jgi:hypothetical protein